MYNQSRCLSEREMLLTGNSFERAIFGYIVPVFVIFGIAGNVLNFTVLLSPQMRSRSWLLSCLAVCDIFFLIFMLPHSLAHYRLFAFNYMFRKLYLSYKINLIALTNWASAAAIWIILSICFERLIGVRYPFLVRRYAFSSTLCRRSLIGLVVTITGLVTLYRHFSHLTIMRPFCNGTQIYAYHVAVAAAVWPGNRPNPNPYWLRRLISLNTRIHELFVVFIPTVIIAIANIMLLLTLKKRNKLLLVSTGGAGLTFSGSKSEQSIAYTICAIVTCFTLTQMVITNFMVIIGKSINFVLFCLSSATFRNRLIALIKSKLLKASKNNDSTRHTSSSNRRLTKKFHSLDMHHSLFQNRTQRILSEGQPPVAIHQRHTVF